MYPIFASFIIFVIFFSWSMHRHKNDDRLETEDFFARERKANATRKKPLDSLDYIEIPDTLLTPINTHLLSSVSNSSMDVTNNLPPYGETISADDLYDLEEYLKRLLSLKDKKIVNLTGQTNTDLKLEYGVANLNNLITYDENYTRLIQSIQDLAICYYRIGYLEVAKKYLDFSVSTHSDMCSSYILLANIDFELGLHDDLVYLLQSIEQIPGSRRATIDRKLKEFYQSHDLLHS